jgi:hypothetical protein
MASPRRSEVAGSPAAVNTAGGANPIPAAGEVDHYREQLGFYSGVYETAMPLPVAPPVLTQAGGASTLEPGLYECAYSWVNGNGETKISPTASIIVAQASQLTITAPAKPAGVTLIGFYISQFPVSNEPSVAELPEMVLAAPVQAGVALVVSAMVAPPFAPAPRGTGNGDSDDFKTNAYYGGRPAKPLQNRDATAYPTQTTRDSWIVALRQDGVTQ